MHCAARVRWHIGQGKPASAVRKLLLKYNPWGQGLIRYMGVPWGVSPGPPCLAPAGPCPPLVDTVEATFSPFAVGKGFAAYVSLQNLSGTSPLFAGVASLGLRAPLYPKPFEAANACEATWALDTAYGCQHHAPRSNQQFV